MPDLLCENDEKIENAFVRRIGLGTNSQDSTGSLKTLIKSLQSKHFVIVIVVCACVCCKNSAMDRVVVVTVTFAMHGVAATVATTPMLLTFPWFLGTLALDLITSTIFCIVVACEIARFNSRRRAVWSEDKSTFENAEIETTGIDFNRFSSDDENFNRFSSDDGDVRLVCYVLGLSIPSIVVFVLFGVNRVCWPYWIITGLSVCCKIVLFVQRERTVCRLKKKIESAALQSIRAELYGISPEEQTKNEVIARFFDDYETHWLDGIFENLEVHDLKTRREMVMFYAQDMQRYGLCTERQLRAVWTLHERNRKVRQT